jgi:outer membrane protein assembly factor BamB
MMEGQDEPFVMLGETLVFVTDGGGLAAFDAAGTALWTLEGVGADRTFYFQANGQHIALAVRVENRTLFRLVDAAGQVLYETNYERIAAAAAQPDGQWLVLNGSELNRIHPGENHRLNAISPPPGRTATMTADVLGNSYIYLGDAQRTLLALDMNGNVRWRVNAPYIAGFLAPILDVGNGCLLYVLSVDGLLSVFNATNGALVTQRQLYAGGEQTGSPTGRLLNVDANERVQVGAGFLTMVTLDGSVLGGEPFANCLLG